MGQAIGIALQNRLMRQAEEKQAKELTRLGAPNLAMALGQAIGDALTGNFDWTSPSQWARIFVASTTQPPISGLGTWRESLAGIGSAFQQARFRKGLAEVLGQPTEEEKLKKIGEYPELLSVFGAKDNILGKMIFPSLRYDPMTLLLMNEIFSRPKSTSVELKEGQTVIDPQGKEWIVRDNRLVPK